MREAGHGEVEGAAPGDQQGNAFIASGRQGLGDRLRAPVDIDGTGTGGDQGAADGGAAIGRKFGGLVGDPNAARKGGGSSKALGLSRIAAEAQHEVDRPMARRQGLQGQTQGQTGLGVIHIDRGPGLRTADPFQPTGQRKQVRQSGRDFAGRHPQRQGNAERHFQVDQIGRVVARQHAGESGSAVLGGEHGPGVRRAGGSDPNAAIRRVTHPQHRDAIGRQVLRQRVKLRHPALQHRDSIAGQSSAKQPPFGAPINLQATVIVQVVAIETGECGYVVCALRVVATRQAEAEDLVDQPFIGCQPQPKAGRARIEPARRQGCGLRLPSGADQAAIMPTGQPRPAPRQCGRESRRRRFAVRPRHADQHERALAKTDPSPPFGGDAD